MARLKKTKLEIHLREKMVDCEYRNGKAFSGSFFEYDDEFIFSNGVLIQENNYAKKNKKYYLVQSTFYDSNQDGEILKK